MKKNEIGRENRGINTSTKKIKPAKNIFSLKATSCFASAIWGK